MAVPVRLLPFITEQLAHIGITEQDDGFEEAMEYVLVRTSAKLGELADFTEGKSVGTFKGDTFDKEIATSVIGATTPELARFKKGKQDAALRVVKKLQDKTRTRLQRTVERYIRGSLSKTKMRRELRSILKAAYSQAYATGLRSLGIDQIQLAAGGSILNAADQQFVQSAFAEEGKHLKKLIDAIIADQSRLAELPNPMDGYVGKLRREIRLRLADYARVVRSMYDAARVVSHPPTTIIYWVLESRNPCPDCVYLWQNSPYTKFDLPTTPRSGLTRCLTHCHCVLRFVQAETDVSIAVGDQQKKKRTHIQTIRRNQRQRGGPRFARINRVVRDRRTGKRVKRLKSTPKSTGVGV